MSSGLVVLSMIYLFVNGFILGMDLGRRIEASKHCSCSDTEGCCKCRSSSRG